MNARQLRRKAVSYSLRYLRKTIRRSQQLASVHFSGRLSRKVILCHKNRNSVSTPDLDSKRCCVASPKYDKPTHSLVPILRATNDASLSFVHSRVTYSISRVPCHTLLLIYSFRFRIVHGNRFHNVSRISLGAYCSDTHTSQHNSQYWIAQFKNI